MITDTVTIDIPYVAGDSTFIFLIVGGVAVLMIIKWIIDILP